MKIEDIDWTLPLKAHRVPTRADVEDRAKEIGARFWMEELRHTSVSHRRYWLEKPGQPPEVLQECGPGERPDWTAMMRRIGCDWIV